LGVDGQARISHLSQLAFGAGGLVLGRAQRSDVHLLGLFPHVLLVGGDGLHDEEVRVDDGEEGQEVAEERVDEDVAAVHGVLAEIVGSAGGHVALRGVLAPAEHGCDGPQHGEGPDAQVAHHGALAAQGGAGHAFHDDVVPVKSDDGHGPDGSAAEKGAEHSVELAHGRSCKDRGFNLDEKFFNK